MSCPCNQPPQQSCKTPQQTQCCPSQFCHDGLLNLPERARLNLTGVEQGSKCLGTFQRQKRGFVIYDGNGGAIVSEQPNAQTPLLRSVVLDSRGHPIVSASGREQELDPPAFDAMVVTDECSNWYRIRGRADFRQKLVWTGCKFVFEADMSEAELEDFPSVEHAGSCNQFDAVLVDKGGGTYGLGYRQSSARVPGEIMPFAGGFERVPAGWLVCDGTALNMTEYPDLFSNIGYSWGKAGNDFRLPDLRGRFIRGVDDGADIDPDAGGRKAIYTGGNTGDAVGTYQDDAFQCHTHEVKNSLDVGSGTDTADGIKTDTANLEENPAGLLEVGSPAEDTCGEVRTADETRPVNAAVIYLIFAGCRIQA